MFDKKILQNVDWLFLILLALLLLVSMFVLASASGNISDSQPLYYVQRQILFLSVGVIALLGTALFNYRKLDRKSVV